MESDMRLNLMGVSAGVLFLVIVAACAEAPVAAQAPRSPQQVLADVAEAYRDAPALTDEIHVEIGFGGTTQSTERSFVAGPGTDVRLVIDGFVFTAVGDRVSAYRQDRPEKYFETPIRGNLPETYLQLTGGVPLPVPQLAMRSGAAPADYLPSLGMQIAANLRLAGGETVRRGDRSLEMLRLEGDNGATVEILVEPRTSFMERIEVKAGAATLVATMRPKRHDALPEPITFDAAGRRRVDSMTAVAQLSQGDPAPDFTLPTLDGEPVTLSDHRGSVVVLDFWATWCGPCRMGLPKLQQFQNWARTEGLAVEVIPINLAERVRGYENIKKRVATFWAGGGFTMQTLVDYENSMGLAYDVGPIPHTVVVGPDGIIRHVETGYRPAFADELKKLARTLQTDRTGS
jgi:peroxiredoxin